MKLALSTDFGSSRHWARLVDFARHHAVDRLVFWGDYSTAKFTPPFLLPRYPDWLTDDERRQRHVIRRRMAEAAKRTQSGGVLVLPPGSDVARSTAAPTSGAAFVQRRR